jgi:hypothetical protein
MSIATQSIVARKLRITITASYRLANGHSVTLADLTSIDAAAQGGAAQGSRIFHSQKSLNALVGSIFKTHSAELALSAAPFPSNG